MDPVTYAVIALIVMGIGAIWDFIEPDSVRIKVESPFRAVFISAWTLFSVVAIASIAGLSIGWGVAIALGLLVLSVLRGELG